MPATFVPRSDLETQARSALAASPIHPLRQLRVEQVDETLRLSGKVDSFYHKQLAQELVRAACRECELDNTVVVRISP